jgi:Cd2+/Zn2+-exporting ATPase
MAMKADIKMRLYPSSGDAYKKPEILVLLSLFVSAALICVSGFASRSGHLGLYLTVAAALIAGAGIAVTAVRDILERAFLRENLPVLLAAALSFAVGRAMEGALALLLLRLSYLVRDYALHRTRSSISERIEPDSGLRPEQPPDRPPAAVIGAGSSELTETEKRCTAAAGWLTPIALFAALALVLLLPLSADIPFIEALRRAVTIIAVASPCSLLLSIPLTYFAGMAAAGRLGVIFGHTGAVDGAAGLRTVIFDKSGTITDRRLQITEIKADKLDAETFLRIAARVCEGSHDRIFKGIADASGEGSPGVFVSDVSETYGEGRSASIDGIRVKLGRRAYFEASGPELPDGDCGGARAYMSVNGIYVGWLALSESIREGSSADCLTALERAGVERIAMVSGDDRQADKAIANALGIEEYHAECTAEEKLKLIGEMKRRLDPRGKLAFVGDAETDGRLFRAADLSVKVNGQARGHDFTSADILIMKSGIARLAPLILLSRRIRRYVLGGVVFAGCVKLSIIALAALGYAPVWFGLLIDSCASLAVLLNCMRLCPAWPGPVKPSGQDGAR